MIEIEYHRMRSAELLREAEQERLAREAVRARRHGRHGNAARRALAPESHIGSPRRSRFARTA
ncbi:hypothetical protein [Streptomyces sp. NPDC002671]